jgi:hypothetical protein
MDDIVALAVGTTVQIDAKKTDYILGFLFNSA